MLLDILTGGKEALSQVSKNKETVVVVGIDQAADILVRTATVDRPDSPNLFVLH